MDVKHQHNANDIIIKDQDGRYKILRDGQFFDLEKVESPELAAQHGDEMKKPAMATPQPPQKKPEEGKAMEAIEKSRVTFPSREQHDRAQTLLVSYFKGLRKAFEVKQRLITAVKEGGVGLSEPEAERLVAAIGGKVQEMRPKIDVSKTKKPESIVKAPARPVGQEIHPPKPVAAKRFPIEEDFAIVPPKPRMAPTGAVAPKPSLADVQKPASGPRGLAAQLGYSLADWRRLAPNPFDRIKKIENQLGVLEEDGYPQRIAGIQGWRHSDVFRQYLSAAQRSLENGQPLERVLGQGSGNELSWDEWKAVAELSNRIAF